MKFAKYLCVLLIMLLTSSSCVEDISVDLGDGGVVVDCILYKKKTQSLRLYRMKEKYGQGVSPITNASVNLYAYNDETDEYLEVAKFTHFNGVEWRADYEPGYNVRYKLKVVMPDRDSIIALTRFPEDLILLSTQLIYKDGDNQLNIETNADTIHYYIPSYSVMKANWALQLHKVLLFHNEFKLVDGQTVPYKNYLEVYKDSCHMWIFPHIDAEFKSHKFNSHLFLEEYDFHGATYPYSKYIVTDHNGVDNCNSTNGTVSDLNWCNIPLLYAKRNYSQWPLLVSPELPLHNGFLRINHPANFHNDTYKNGIQCLPSQYSFFLLTDYNESFGYDEQGIYRNYYSGVFETHFVSDEYDAYLLDMYHAKNVSDIFILSAYERKDIYSNIQGAFGIFGADNITWDLIEPSCYDTWSRHIPNNNPYQ